MTVRQTAPTPPKMLVPPSATPAIASSGEVPPRPAWPIPAGGRGVDQAGEPAGGAGDDEGEDDGPVDLQARQPGGVAVAADAVEVAAEDGVGQHELQDDGDDEEDDHGVLDAADLVLPDEREHAARRGDLEAAAVTPSARPVNESPLASVARNALTRSFVTITPLTRPISAPEPIATGKHHHTPQWTAAHAPSTSLSAKIAPSERSKLPAMIVNVTAHAAMPTVAFW